MSTNQLSSPVKMSYNNTLLPVPLSSFFPFPGSKLFSSPAHFSTDLLPAFWQAALADEKQNDVRLTSQFFFNETKVALKSSHAVIKKRSLKVMQILVAG
jgi:hypothetical protein